MQLAQKDESLHKASEDLKEKTRECERIAQTLKDREAFIERMTKGKRYEEDCEAGVYGLTWEFGIVVSHM